MDCLHDLGDPVGALVRTRKAIKGDGKVLLVEPYDGDRLEENLNPIGRMYYAASAMACTTNSLSRRSGSASVRRRRGAPAQGGAGSRLLQLAARGAHAGQPDPRTHP